LNIFLDKVKVSGGFTMDLKQRLNNYMNIPAPSGYEGEMAYRLKVDLAPFCDEVRLDRFGNCIAKIKGAKSGLPRVMVFGHMDQIGFIIRKIDAGGFIQVERLGGIPERVLAGLEVLVRSEDGKWHPGVIGMKSHHATPVEEAYKVEKLADIRMDIGAKSKEEVNGLGIHIGCPVIYKPAFTALAGNRVCGTAVDNRGGCACLVRIAEKLCEKRQDCDVYLVGTVWEEFNMRGGILAAREIEPDIAISLDVSIAGDTADLSGRYDDALGGGPCVQLYSRGTHNGTMAHAPLFRLALESAARAGCNLQRFASTGMLTDLSHIQLEGRGAASLEMCFPVRYTHSPVEICDVNDIEKLSKVVAEMTRNIDETFKLDRY